MPSAVAVNPATNRVVASVAVGSRPVSIASGEGAVWVGDARDGTVSRVDPASRRVAKTIGIGGPAVDLATGAGAVWAATGGFGEVVRIDAGLDAAAERIPLGSPGDLAVPRVSSVGAGDGRVWAGAFEGLARIDPGSGRVTGRVNLGRAAATGIAVGGDALWATTLRRRAKRVEAGSGQVTADFYAGVFVLPVALDESGGLGRRGRRRAVCGSSTRSRARRSSRRAPAAGRTGSRSGSAPCGSRRGRTRRCVQVNQFDRRRARDDPRSAAVRRTWPSAMASSGWRLARRPSGPGRTLARRGRRDLDLAPDDPGAHAARASARSAAGTLGLTRPSRAAPVRRVSVRVTPVRRVPSRTPRRNTMKPAS